LSGSYFFDNDAYSLDFGVMTSEVDNQSAYANVQADSWGGVGTPADYDDSLFEVDSVRRYFSNIPGSNNPNLVEEFLRVDFPAAIDAAQAAIGGTRWGPTDVFQVDRRTKEETTSAYVQFNASFDMGDKPANLAAGLRYEQTDVTSDALVPVATRILWAAANEFTVEKVGSDFTTLKGDYDYVLPSIDFNVEVAEDMILRLGYSETIGRPGWGDIQGGQTIDDSIRINGGNGNQGDPGLLPLESTNIDVSFEWYYGSGSYASVSYFNKDIENYITISTITGTPFNLPHPGQGARYAEADAATGGTGDPIAIRQYIFTNYGSTPEVTITGTDLSGNFTGTIEGIAGEDPASEFQIFVPTNASTEGVDGWELAVQHMFGDTGFGLSANYTIVNTDNEYDDLNAANQFVLEGISDSANLIVFFENDVWSTRVAYNWRDEYLDARLDGAGQPNPIYIESYGQLDANVSYNYNEDLTFFVEGINLTDEYTRSYARTQNAAAYVTTTGARYMIGARYNFR
jgi:TonB-dependent receptor